MANVLLYLCITLFIVVCLFLIMVILIQKGRGGGLSNAFGGGAGGHTAFGSKTGDVLTWVTSIVFGVFLLLAVALNLLADYRSRQVHAVALPAAEATTASETAKPPVEQPQTPTQQSAPAPAATQPAQ